MTVTFDSVDENPAVDRKFKQENINNTWEKYLMDKSYWAFTLVQSFEQEKNRSWHFQLFVYWAILHKSIKEIRWYEILIIFKESIFQSNHVSVQKYSFEIK